MRKDIFDIIKPYEGQHMTVIAYKNIDIYAIVKLPIGDYEKYAKHINSIRELVNPTTINISVFGPDGRMYGCGVDCTRIALMRENVREYFFLNRVAQLLHDLIKEADKNTDKNTDKEKE